MTKAVIDSSVIIALSYGFFDYLDKLFNEILTSHDVFDELCWEKQSVMVRLGWRGRDRRLVEALIDPLGRGEAESIALAAEEEADIIVIDDRLARSKARTMEFTVIVTLRILRMTYDHEFINSENFIELIQALRETGFRLSERVIKNIKELV